MCEMRFGKGSTSVLFNTESLGFQVSYNEYCFYSDVQKAPCFFTKDNKKVMFTDARKIEHCKFESGVGEGVRSRFSDFALPGGNYDLAFETYIWVEEETGHLKFEFLPIKEEKFELARVVWPVPVAMEPSDKAHTVGYTVLPIMQGVLIQDACDREINPSLSRRMFSRECSMPWWGQISDKNGYMAIVETAWDAEYDYHHAPKSQTGVCVNWIGSLGKIQYRRKLALHFFKECNYVTFCKEYRAYLKAKGSFVSVEEKIIKNPKVGELIGNPIIHTDAVHWNCEPESVYYDTENPESNYRVQAFENIAKKIENIKALGVDKAYVHIDGWGKHGYDNHHPDIIPPSQPAGGVAGMHNMLERIRCLGYIPALHDQYRDYYMNAETYNENQAVMLPDGTLDTCAIWPGGKQAMLCAQLAPDYVSRNYNWLERSGLKPDGVYLDVFSVVELDECANKMHEMTRKECMEKRCESFEIIRSRGMIVSSEEPIDLFVSHLDLVHHGPYAYAIWESVKTEPFGIPIPLFNLVYHDSIIMPWSMGKGCWGLPQNEDGMLHALLNGGMPYLSLQPDQTELDRVNVVLKLHAVVAKSEMISHSFVDGITSKQRTVFSCNTEVMVDFESGGYAITWPDQSITEGSALIQ